ncbi:MAG: hypothetical protein V3S24_11175 [Candidatus Tectomicrobia bacterium]
MDYRTYDASKSSGETVHDNVPRRTPRIPVATAHVIGVAPTGTEGRLLHVL